ncbi:outer membrane efflux protein [Bordetella pertussis]|nr:outer membrane efflux protein [Bordetella pertussis]CPN17808.1 outer membrane efflux protein [Bordetella pertussis]CPN87119.1 outer membrane efflux protein [Bordetella pertussis]
MMAVMCKRSALSVLVAAALAGCSLAPDYKRPEAPVQANWPDQPKVQYGAYASPTSLGEQPAAAVAPQGATPADEIGWCEFFRDARLQKLIELALVNNRDLRVAVQRVEEARAQYGVQRGAQWPSIGAGIQGQRQHLPPDMRPLGPDSTSISSQYQAGLGLTTFEIDLFGRLRNLSEAAYQQYLSTEQAQRSVHITLVGAVAQSYFNLRAAEVQLELTQKTLASRQESYNLVKTRFDGGVASELDLNQSKSLLDSASADLAALARARAGRQRPGGAGRAAGPARGPAGAGRIRPRPVAGQRAGRAAVRPADAPARHPGGGEPAQGGQCQYRRGARGVLPDHFADRPVGRGQHVAGHPVQGRAGLLELLAVDHHAPVRAGGSIREGLNLAKARDNIAVAQYEQSIQQAFREVSDTLAGEATYSAQLDAQRALQVAAGRTLELSNLRYNNGIDSYLQVQTAQVDFFNAQLALVQTGLAALINRVELYKALGGGWQESTTKQP